MRRGALGDERDGDSGLPEQELRWTRLNRRMARASLYHALGNVYLAGPYKGAPLSLVFVTLALAGPFDLGTVVVRVALYVDPETA